MSIKLEDVIERFDRVNVAPKTERAKSLRQAHPHNEKLQAALESSGFSIFEAVADLGFFGWTPKGSMKSLRSVSASDVIDSIDIEGKPDEIVSLSSMNRNLPMRFAQGLSSQKFPNKYPYDQYYVASVHVAFEHRGIDMDEIDFIFGGSTLEMLATKTIQPDAEYLVTKIPGSNIITVVKYSDYVQDFADPGFQFERFVTGKRFDDPHSLDKVEHLQVMRVGDYHVLFSAEVDALNEYGDPVEVKASNPRYWGTKVMFQMISSGSNQLCAGTKARGTLTGVSIHDLKAFARETLLYSEVKEIERNILGGMKEVLAQAQSLLTDGNTCKIAFPGGKLKLTHFSNDQHKIFPPETVVNELTTQKNEKSSDASARNT